MLLSKPLLLLRTSSGAGKRHGSHVAFIGLGNMGAKMANNLIKKGETLKVYDIAESVAKSVAGAQVCKSPEEAADGASIVITMLPTGQIVKDTFLKKDGILKSIPKNSYIVDSSTIDPKDARELFNIAKEHNVKFVDAPVSGGVPGAENATLTFMVGGTKEDATTLEPVLLKMGKKVIHCGDIGAGQVTKLCNNLILGATMIATAEAMNLGVKSGIDPKLLASVVNISTGRSWSSDTYNPVPGVMENVPSSKNYDGGFMTKLIAKDLALAENVAATCGAPVAMTAAAHQMYRMMMVNGLGDKDFSSVYKFLKG